MDAFTVLKGLLHLLTNFKCFYTMTRAIANTSFLVTQIFEYLNFVNTKYD